MKSVRGSTVPLLLIPQPVLHTLTRRHRTKMFSAVAGVSYLPLLQLATFFAVVHLWHACPGRGGCFLCPVLRLLPPQPFRLVLGARLPRRRRMKGSRRCCLHFLLSWQGRQLRAVVLCGSQQRREDVWGWYIVVLMDSYSQRS